HDILRSTPISNLFPYTTLFRSKTRQIQINEGFNLIISDTVGFIQKLPTTLIAAFKSTLEEAKNADLLLHVVDSSHPEYRGQYDRSEEHTSELQSRFDLVCRLLL